MTVPIHDLPALREVMVEGGDSTAVSAAGESLDKGAEAFDLMRKGVGPAPAEVDRPIRRGRTPCCRASGGGARDEGNPP